MSHHQNSHSSWSLMYDLRVAHYECKTWGLPRSLGSYISFFITDMFETQKEHVRVEAFSDVGFILISMANPISGNLLNYYVANPISRQCVEIPNLPYPPHLDALFSRPGLAMRIENCDILGYNVVLMEKISYDVQNLLTFSSETGLWSSNILHPHLHLRDVVFVDLLSLNGSLYWVGYDIFYGDVIVSHDFYSNGTESDRCRVILFPDLGKALRFSRFCTTSQGFLTYMNIVRETIDEETLRLWRLKSGKWQLVSEISLDSNNFSLGYFPVAMNPFNANTVYRRNREDKRLVSTNLHKGKFELYNNLERSSNGRILSIAGDWNYDSHLFPFVLPRWLHRISTS